MPSNFVTTVVKSVAVWQRRLHVRLKRFLQRSERGNERLWKIWWLGGLAVGWSASVLVVAAEELRAADYHVWGDVLDFARLLIYYAWLRFAWRCAGNVDHPLWAPVSRFALGAGLVFMAIL
jgi:hypothetical protein